MDTLAFEDAGLGHVVCAGASDDELLDALRAFSAQITIWEAQLIDDCDVLVICDPSLQVSGRCASSYGYSAFTSHFTVVGCSGGSDPTYREVRALAGGCAK